MSKISIEYNPNVGEDLNDWIRSNNKLIWSRCHAFSYSFNVKLRGIMIEDLYSEALYSTIWAYQEYKENKNSKFSTFVCDSIDYKLKKLYQNTNKYSLAIHVPILVKSIAASLQKDWINEQISSNPTITEVSEKYQITKNKAKHALSYWKMISPISFNQQIKKSNSGVDTFDELVGSLDNDDSTLTVQDIVSNFNQKELEILKYLEQGISVKEISEILGCSRPTIYKHVKTMQTKTKDYYKGLSESIDLPTSVRGNNQKKRDFKAISPSGKIHYSNSPINFASEHGLHSDGVQRVLSGKYKKHKKWYFEYVV